jgi:hypothetical protein
MTKPTGLQYHLATGSAWTDITSYVLYSRNVEINKGRQDLFATVQAGTMTATLDNSDGRFASGDGFKQGINYITNPRFNVNLAGWTPSANLTAVWDVTSVAAKLTATSTAALTYQFTVTLPASAVGKTFWVTGSINASGTAIGKTVLQKVEFYNGASALISTLTRTAPVTLVSGWNTVATFMTVPAGTVTAKVFPLHVPAGWAVNDFVLLDNAAFTDYVDGRYFDGSQITWQDGATYGNNGTPRDTGGFFQYSRWNGITDASTSTLYRAIPYYTAMNPDNGIRVRFPDPNNNNLAKTPADASFEDFSVGTWAALAGWGSIANTNVRAWDGVRSLQLTSSTTGGQASVGVDVTCGLTYTMQIRVWVTAGQPDVNFGLLNNVAPPVTTALKAQWVTLTNTFTVPLGYASSTINPDVWWNSAGTAGQQVWIDGFHMWEGSVAPPAFVTGPNPQYQYRFKGFLSTIPVQWPGGNKYSEVQVSAADHLAVLNRRTFRSVVQEEILNRSPIAYYTLGEPTGSLAAADSSGNGQQPLRIVSKGTTGTVSFGTGTGPPTDGLTATQFTPVNSSNFKFLAAHYPSALSNFLDDKTIIATFAAPTATGKQCIWRIFDESHYWNTWDLGFSGASLGKLVLSWSAGQTMTSPLRYDDGLTHQVAITCGQGSGTQLTLTMYVDGAQVATTTTSTASTMASVNWFQVGGDLKYADPFNGTLSHVAIFQSSLAGVIADMWPSQKNGYVNDRSDDRIRRYARWAGLSKLVGGILTENLALETGSLLTTDHLDTSGLSASSAVETIATAEGGLTFVDRAGNLAFHARPHRWDAPPVVTLGPDDIGKDTQLVVDNQLLVNQVTSNSKTAANLTVANSSSIAAHGVYPVTLDLVTTSTDDATYITQWAATVNSTPKPRTNTIFVDLLTSPQATSDLFKTLEVGSTIAITGLPDQAPTPDMLLVVEGWREVIGTDEWSLLINTSTTVPMWKLEDPLYGGIDSVNRIAY